jgi:hypothetical protein
MGTILPRLFAIFREAGHEPLTGYSTYYFPKWPDAPFTVFLKDDKPVGCPGLGLQEIMFIEHFREYIRPNRIFIVGNALGWSTVALSLIFPDALTVAIDPDSAAIEWTNDLIARHRLSAIAVEARSPSDVAVVVEQHLKGRIDFSLIDAIHTNDAIVADFAAVHAVSSKKANHLFHDVINWRMLAGFTHILAKYDLSGKTFPRTPSGMALAYTVITPEFSNYLDCFVGPLMVPEIPSSIVPKVASWIKPVGRSVLPNWVKVRLRQLLRGSSVDQIVAQQRVANLQTRGDLRTVTKPTENK